MITVLLTRYILVNVWTRLLIFIIFYLVVQELHFIEVDFSSADCMNENNSLIDIPQIAEAKIKNIPRSVMEREIVAFTGYPEIIQEQQNTINVLREEIKQATIFIVGAEKELLELKNNLKETIEYTSALDKEFYPLLDEQEELKNQVNKLKRELIQVTPYRNLSVSNKIKKLFNLK